ncbi:E3 ubiquitin-protein ligase TRIM9-like [Tachypleus tridentatus]|uniref:E3 ubiquitin-protein ligase TRIM9-like n=1 Tax=Tachypleus tridentatus TaxID=6853 RepID=UPI003FD54D99
MEEELRCPICKQFFKNPVLLPCYHSICLKCALHCQQPAQQSQQHSDDSLNSLNEVTSDYSDVDKLSLVSETDSGVVCNSRPNSYVGTPNFHGILFPPIHSSALSLVCPLCQKIIYFDDNGANNLPKNRTLQNIVDKYKEARNLPVCCQLCEGDPREAVVMCEQCEIFYCKVCRDGCHPARGPLIKHSLVSLQKGKLTLRARNKERKLNCSEHAEESLSMYCMLCKVPVCVQCLDEGNHTNHDAQALGTMCKAQKTELSHILQSLSEKAKEATDFIQRIKSVPEEVLDNCIEFEATLSSQCDLLSKAVHARKQQLLEFARQERDQKIKTLRDQITSYTTKLQQTTGLLQFCIEALKETDPTSFLQVGAALGSRVTDVDNRWNQEMALTPCVTSDFNYALDYQFVLEGINHMTFLEEKPPGPPVIISERCSSANNTITLAWQPQIHSFVEYYTVEVLEDNNGFYKVIYRGIETVITLDTLHFNSKYKARVKAFNNKGESPYSEEIQLSTEEVHRFTLDSMSAHPDIVLFNNNQTVICHSFEHRVVLGNVGFSRGVHYWEFTVDKYGGHADPAFGVAKTDVALDKMLGKDDKGWSMYIDHQRSWFLHADHHGNRTEGGVDAECVVGVLLDLDLHQLSFYVNGELQGDVAFSGLQGFFFPAVSINRNVQITVQTALEPPLSAKFGVK